VKVVFGHARFVGPHELEVATTAGARRIRSKKFLIAVGSRPYRPRRTSTSRTRACATRDTILKLDSTPDSITIYGAGVVGCEYASIFRNLGVKVNLLNSRDKLLSFLDDEIVDALAYHLRDQGVVIRHNEEPLASRRSTTGSCCTSRAASASRRTCSSGHRGAPATRTISASRTWASPRTPAVSSRSTITSAPASRTSMPVVT
jgi:pyruvate/2-oxoglutarate dehydrogenase complex dihydrolipoamide dehydrogenase (E3) component